MGIELIIIVVMALIIWWLVLSSGKKDKQLEESDFKFKSKVVKYGKNTEQYLPFMKDFPYASDDCRFIGMPIDYIIFAEDKLVVLEFKTGNSKLSEKQEKIKQLVEEKKVYWEEWRI